MFPAHYSYNTFRADGWGGITTLIPHKFQVLAENCSEYFVGVLCASNNTKILLLNIYIPPNTSPVAPSDYGSCLKAAHAWITEMRLCHGFIAHTIWAGDFNARMGRRVFPSAADSEITGRGRCLLASMP